MVKQGKLAATQRDRRGGQRVDVGVVRIEREGSQQRHWKREKPEEEAERDVATRKSAK